MESVVKILFPVGLLIGALYLVILEILAYPRLKRFGLPVKHLNSRFARRVFGALVISFIAILLYWGLNNMWPPQVGQEREELNRQARYWSIVASMVFLIIVLAIWDALEGVKHIEKIIERDSIEQIREIQKHLSKQDSVGKTKK